MAPAAAVRPSRTRAVALGTALLLLALSLAGTRVDAATLTVTQEQVVLGSTTGAAATRLDDGVRETLTEADAAPDPVSLPATESAAPGVRASGSFPGDLQSSDNASLVYVETSPIRAISETRVAGRNATGCGWASCPAGTASDNASAASPANLDAAAYAGFGFALPAGAANLTVEVGVEAYESGGNDRLTVAVSWDGGATYCAPSQVYTAVPAADPNAYAWFNFTPCGGHAWSAADFTGDAIRTRFTHAQVGGTNETIYLDANAVRVAYRIRAEYACDMRLDWSSMPAGQAYALTVEAAVSDENMTLEVLTPPSSWTPRHTFTATTDSTFTLNLTPAEVNAGAAAIRFVDASGPDANPSSLRVDLAAITSVVLAYGLDVRQEVSGVTGGAPTLTIRGRTGASAENFDVYAWNVSAGTWNLKLRSPFGPTDAYHNASLSPEEVEAGLVRLRYVDADPLDGTPSELDLDLVAVVATAVAQGSPDALVLGGGAAVAVALSLTPFLVLWRRRSSHRPKEGRHAPAHPREPGTVVQGSSVLGPGVPAAALKSGRSYLLEEESPARSLKLLEDLTRIGRSGLFLTGRDPRTASEGYRFRRTRSVRLAESGGPTGGDRLAPSLETLRRAIEDFLRGNPVGVVLVEGADFLAERNRPRGVSRFLHDIAEAVARGEQVFLVSVSPATISARERKAFDRALEVRRARTARPDPRPAGRVPSGERPQRGPVPDRTPPRTR